MQRRKTSSVPGLPLIKQFTSNGIGYSSHGQGSPVEYWKSLNGQWSQIEQHEYETALASARSQFGDVSRSNEYTGTKENVMTHLQHNWLLAEATAQKDQTEAKMRAEAAMFWRRLPKVAKAHPEEIVLQATSRASVMSTQFAPFQREAKIAYLDAVKHHARVDGIKIAFAEPGYVCKQCGGPAPLGIGFPDDSEGAYERSEGLTSCACGYSVLPEGVTASTKTAGDEVSVAKVPECDICAHENQTSTPAYADARLPGLGGIWANVCKDHFGQYGGSLGTGNGQVFVQASKTASTSRIDALRDIVNSHQRGKVPSGDGKVSGVDVDPQTANMLVTLYDALNDKNNASFETMDLMKLINFGWSKVSANTATISDDEFDSAMYQWGLEVGQRIRNGEDIPNGGVRPGDEDSDKPFPRGVRDGRDGKTASTKTAEWGERNFGRSLADEVYYDEEEPTDSNVEQIARDILRENGEPDPHPDLLADTIREVEYQMQTSATFRSLASLHRQADVPPYVKDLEGDEAYDVGRSDGKDAETKSPAYADGFADEVEGRPSDANYWRYHSDLRRQAEVPAYIKDLDGDEAYEEGRRDGKDAETKSQPYADGFADEVDGRPSDSNYWRYHSSADFKPTHTYDGVPVKLVTKGGTLVPLAMIQYADGTQDWVAPGDLQPLKTARRTKKASGETYEVCSDCYFAAAGYSEHELGQPFDREPLSQIPGPVTPGDEIGFGHSACEGCGSTLAGDRFTVITL